MSETVAGIVSLVSLGLLIGIPYIGIIAAVRRTERR